MKKFDAIVIGGGAIGCAIFYNLSKKGLKVLLVEKSDLAGGTSGACDAYITPHTKKVGVHLEFCLRSQDLYDQLEDELAEDLEYIKNRGGFTPCEDEISYQLVADNAENLIDAGLHVEMLRIDDFLKLEPNMSPDLVGALYCPSAGQVNPFKMIYAYVNKAKKMGSEVMTHTKVTGLIEEDDVVIGIATDKGEFYADTVVNAAGSWGGIVAQMAGLDMPIKPRRGQLVVTEPVAPMLHSTMQSGMYMVIKHRPELITDEKVKRLGSGYAIEQTDDGTIIIGFTREFVGFDNRTTLEGIESIVQEGCKYVPGLRDLHIIRTYAGLRPFTPDAFPIIGEAKDKKGFFMAAGHEGDGIALAPITGKIVAEMIVDGKPSMNIDEFSPDRFIDYNKHSN